LVERAKAKSGPFYGVGGVQPDDSVFIDKTVVANQTYYYRVKPSNTSTGSLSEIDSVSIGSVEMTARTGVVETLNSRIDENVKPLSVFPNPTSGQDFFVKISENIENATITLHGTNGQDVPFSQRKIDAQTISIHPTQKLQSGIYLIKSQVDGKASSVKVIVE
jgi:Secretion system C-terminal sorting domain